MARLEIEIGGKDSGGNGELQETIGLIEELIALKKGLTLDLIKAEDVGQIRAVGENLTAVNLKLGEYMGLASKATQSWRDNRTEEILDGLAMKTQLLNTITNTFGATLTTQQNELRAYQAAFNALITNGVDPADAEVVSLENSIKRLTASISAQQTVLAQQKPLDELAVKLKQIDSNVVFTTDSMARMKATMQANQAAINALIKSGVDPADDRITKLQKTVEQLNAAMEAQKAERFGRAFALTGGLIHDAEVKARSLQKSLNFAKSEADIKRYAAELAEVNKELDRLRALAGKTGAVVARVGSQVSSAGVEFSRIVQDLPYAANNIGSIGNNVTRLVELWPQYIAGARSAAIANGQLATTANVARTALRGMVTGWNGIILLVSAAMTAWTMIQMQTQKNTRELEKETKARAKAKDELQEYIKTLDAESQARGEGRKNAQTEIQQLGMMRRAIENVQVPMKNRMKLMDQLKEKYPEEFANWSKSALLAGEASAAYDKVAESLLKVSLAQAAMDKALEIGRNMIDIQTGVEGRVQDIVKLEAERVKQSRLRAKAEESVWVQMYKQGTSMRDMTREGVDAVADYLSARRREVQIGNQVTALAEQQQKAGAEYQKSLSDVAGLQQKVLDYQIQGADLSGKTAGNVKTQLDNTEKLLDKIREVYTPDTDRGNLIGLEGHTKTLQAIENRYGDMIKKVDSLEKDHKQNVSDLQKKKVIDAAEAAKRITKIESEAAQERKEILEGREREITAATVLYNEQRAAKLAELESKANITRIASRKRDLDADKMYWDGVEANAEKWGITADQLAEYRKSSEAQIHAKWDQKIADNTIAIQNRLNESMSQRLLRQLNESTKAKIKAARGDAQQLLEIEKEYEDELNKLRQRDRDVRMQLSFDGSAMSMAIAKVDNQIALLKESFDKGLIPSVDKFHKGLSLLELQKQRLQAFQNAINGVADSFSGVLTDAIFDSDNAAENFGKRIQDVAKGIIGELIKIGARYLINQALGTSSMAATVATSSVAAGAVSAAWAPAAALVSAATFGASAAAGGTALTALLATTKAMALMPGFARGGYTGNVGRREVAGVVHGQEFVMNASATRDYLPLLNAMNSGKDVQGLLPRMNKNINFGGVTTAVAKQEQVIKVEGAISNNTIRLSDSRATRFDRKFGRG